MTTLLTFLIAFFVIAAVIVGMSLGVLNGRAPISGSCGGLNGGRCELCAGTGRCRKEQEE